MEGLLLKFNGLDSVGQQLVSELIESLLQKNKAEKPEDYPSPPASKPDPLEEPSVQYGGAGSLNLDLLDAASQKMVRDFFQTLLKTQPVSVSPDDPYGNKAWKKKLSSELSIWSEEHIVEWQEDMKKMDTWKIETW